MNRLRVAGVAGLLLIAVASAAAGPPDPQQLVGSWTVDLRPTPDADGYFQEMVVESVEEGRLTGSFYGSPIRNSHLNLAWGAVRFAFVTDDGSGEYHHSAVLADERVEGTTHSVQRGLLSYWTATRVGAEPAASPSPYGGMESRPIKALSPEQVDGYLAGHGMGLALAAELNHHPGPKHVLELADELALDDDQRRATREVFDEMSAEARALGAEIVATERRLDERFAGGGLAEEELADELDRISDLQGRLRLAHLRAHLRMVEILRADQVKRYDQLRGYGAAGSGERVHDPSRHGH